MLLPFWHVAGYALGAGTALLGKEGAMACGRMPGVVAAAAVAAAAACPCHDGLTPGGGHGASDLLHVHVVVW